MQKIGVKFLYCDETYSHHICHYRITYEEELWYSFDLFFKEHYAPLILEVPNLLLCKVENLDEFVNKYIKDRKG